MAPAPGVALESVVAVDVALEVGGSITGVLSGPSGPATGVCARAHRVGSDEVAGEGCAGADGAYVVGGLAGGSYQVRFTPPSSGPGSDHLAEWWDDQPDRVGATPVAVALGQATSGLDAELALAAGIAGTITGPDGPLWRACAHAVELASGSVAATSCTGSGGTYRLGGLAPGTYHLRFDPPPSGPGSDLPGEWWDDQPSAGTATPLGLAGGEQRTGMDAALGGWGGLAGTVTDALTGVPVPGACLAASEPTGTSGGWACSEADGTYRIDGLPPGTYVVDVFAAGHAQAQVVATVSPGGGHDHLDVALDPFGAVAGAVGGPDGAVAGATVSLWRADDPGWWVGEATTGPDGTYEVPVAPGAYLVEVQPPGDPSPSLAGQWWPARPTAATATPVVVAPGEVRGGVDVTLGAAGGTGAIAGVVRGPDGPLAGAEVRVLGTGSEVVASGPTGPDGAYRFDGVPAGGGRRVVAFTGADGLYAKWWHGGSPSIDGAAPVVVVPGTTAPADVTVPALPGSVSGTVTGPGGAPLAGIEVWLVATDSTKAAKVRTDASGRYLMARAPTGAGYRLVVWPKGPGLPTKWWHAGAASPGAARRFEVATRSATTIDVAVPAR